MRVILHIYYFFLLDSAISLSIQHISKHPLHANQEILTSLSAYREYQGNCLDSSNELFERYQLDSVPSMEACYAFCKQFGSRCRGAAYNADSLICILNADAMTRLTNPERVWIKQIPGNGIGPVMDGTGAPDITCRSAIAAKCGYTLGVACHDLSYEACLISSDGSHTVNRGQQCAWCPDGPCVRGSFFQSQCEPSYWLSLQPDRIINYRVASCTEPVSTEAIIQRCGSITAFSEHGDGGVYVYTTLQPSIGWTVLITDTNTKYDNLTFEVISLGGYGNSFSINVGNLGTQEIADLSGTWTQLKISENHHSDNVIGAELLQSLVIFQWCGGKQQSSFDCFYRKKGSPKGDPWNALPQGNFAGNHWKCSPWNVGQLNYNVKLVLDGKEIITDEVNALENGACKAMDDLIFWDDMTDSYDTNTTMIMSKSAETINLDLSSHLQQGMVDCPMMVKPSVTCGDLFHVIGKSSDLCNKKLSSFGYSSDFYGSTFSAVQLCPITLKDVCSNSVQINNFVCQKQNDTKK